MGVHNLWGEARKWFCGYGRKQQRVVIIVIIHSYTEGSGLANRLAAWLQGQEEWGAMDPGLHPTENLNPCNRRVCRRSFPVSPLFSGCFICKALYNRHSKRCVAQGYLMCHFSHCVSWSRCVCLLSCTSSLPSRSTYFWVASLPKGARIRILLFK